MYNSIDDDESNALLSSIRSIDHGGDSNKKVKAASNTSLMINRFLIILLLAGLVAVSIYLQSFQSQLTKKLSTDEEKIQHLEATVVAQGKIIERFNESVTNSDVIGHLKTMEGLWDEERTDLFDQLKQTKTYVETELNSTMIELDKTVKTAEAEIQDQVDTVKKNFDKYKIHTDHQFSLQNDFMIYQVAGTFTVLSCLISMWHMGSHTRKMNQPAIQRKILAILWMCPIYAMSSSLSLVFPSYAGYLSIVKDFYEAYIIYQFLSFCISVIGGGDRNVAIDLLAKQVGHLTPPFRVFFCCCKPHYEDDRALASAILLQCQAFAMQFIFWKPVTSIAMVVLKKYDYYGPYAEDSMDWKSIQFWINIIQNLSTAVAFAGLMKFYHAVDKDLEWCRPFAKFLCIKGVVFMTFWQGMVLKIMAQTTDMGGGGDTADSWSEMVQNFLICIEMLLFSIAHFYCFPVEEWQPGYEANYRKAKFGETMALNDFFTDLRIIMTAENGSKKKKRSKRPSESTILEVDDETETQDDFSAMDNSLMSNDEEDPKDAFVRALTTSSRSFGDEDAESSSQHNLQEAQHRLGNMLDDMLFSPRNSTQNSPTSSSVRRLSLDEGTSSVDNKSDDNDAVRSYHTDETGTGEENNGDVMDIVEDPKETTGLLTGESATSLANNLRPSIFTTISQQQSIEDEGLVAEDERKVDLEEISELQEDGDMEKQAHDDQGEGGESETGHSSNNL